MRHKSSILLLLIAAPALSGCALQAALAARELAQYVPEGQRQSNAHLLPVATQACAERARQHGTATIAGETQPRADLIIVTGSVTDAAQVRRTFECHFATRITRFTLRDI